MILLQRFHCFLKFLIVFHVKTADFHGVKKGPYKIWNHQHIFKEIDQGILVTDIITYLPPFGFIGRIANLLFIKNKVKNIFDYRSKILEKIFN